MIVLQILGLVPGLVLVWAVNRLISEASVIRGPDDYWKLPPALRPPGNWPEPWTNRVWRRLFGARR